eukprot:6177878-Pleurochrysis_carterae.AAC.1
MQQHNIGCTRIKVGPELLLLMRSQDQTADSNHRRLYVLLMFNQIQDRPHKSSLAVSNQGSVICLDKLLILDAQALSANLNNAAALVNGQHEGHIQKSVWKELRDLSPYFDAVLAKRAQQTQRRRKRPTDTKTSL